MLSSVLVSSVFSSPTLPTKVLDEGSPAERASGLNESKQGGQLCRLKVSRLLDESAAREAVVAPAAVVSFVLAALTTAALAATDADALIPAKKPSTSGAGALRTATAYEGSSSCLIAPFPPFQRLSRPYRRPSQPPPTVQLPLPPQPLLSSRTNVMPAAELRSAKMASHCAASGAGGKDTGRAVDPDNMTFEFMDIRIGCARSGGRMGKELSAFSHLMREKSATIGHNNARQVHTALLRAWGTWTAGLLGIDRTRFIATFPVAKGSAEEGDGVGQRSHPSPP